MTDMEQQMIDQAKAGDPKAQYEMSLWARQMSILEPREERWSRLAAKCLVDAAKAGYEPAQNMVQKLMSGEDAQSPDEPELEPELEEKTKRFVPGTQDSHFFDDVAPEAVAETCAPERSVYDQAEEDDYDAYDAEEAFVPEEGVFKATMRKIAAGAKKAGVVVAAAVGGLNTTLRERSVKKPSRGQHDEPAPETKTTRRGGRYTLLDSLNDWIESNRRVTTIVGIAVAVILVALLVILAATPAKTEEAEPTPLIVEATPEPTTEPTPEPFPNEATKQEISSTPTLQYRPGDSDASAYLPASTSFTVQAEVETDDGENLRQGPNSYDYPEVIMRIPNGTMVTAYARYENSDGVVWYLINSGGTWGWMYGPSLG